MYNFILIKLIKKFIKVSNFSLRHFPKWYIVKKVERENNVYFFGVVSHTTIMQGCTHFPTTKKFYESPQNSKCQTRDKKKALH